MAAFELDDGGLVGWNKEQTGIGLAAARHVLRAAMIVLIAIWATTGSEAQSPEQIPSVVVAPVERREVTPSFLYVGRVEAAETVDLVARVEGFLERRAFREGGDVVKGDVLFLIEQAPYRIAVEQREADLAGAAASLENAEKDFERKEALVARRSLAQSSLDQARAALGLARAGVRQAEAALRRARLNLSYTEVASPITGQVSRAAYSVGSFVSPGGGALATVTGMDPINVTIAVAEKDLLDARRRGIDLDNPPVAPSLRLSDGSTYEHAGRFDYLHPGVDRATDTVLARAVFPNPDRLLLPGQFVTVVVRLKTPVRVLVVPQASVQKDRLGYFVVVVDRADRAEVRRVTLGERDGTDWIVADGLAEGERIVVRGLRKVRPDMIVNPVDDQG